MQRVPVQRATLQLNEESRHIADPSATATISLYEECHHIASPSATDNTFAQRRMPSF